MSDPLTLPGSIPGLLRRGSPVIYANPALPHITGRGVVCDPEPEDEEFADVLTPWVGTMHGHDAGQAGLNALAPGCGAVPGFGYHMDGSNVLALDLTDATGRAHAAIALARMVTSRDDIFWAHLRVCDEYGEGAIEGTWLLDWDSAKISGTDYLHTPGDAGPLAALDPDDPRLLPDGSRCVVAEALRRICLHVWEGDNA